MSETNSSTANREMSPKSSVRSAVNQRGELHAAECIVEPIKLAANDASIRVLEKKRVDRIDRDSFRADPVARVFDACNQRGEIVGAGLDDAFPGVGRRIDDSEAVLLLHAFEIPSERSHVGPNVRWGLFERDKYPGLSVANHTHVKVLQRKHRLGASRGAGYQRGTTGGQTSFHDVVEAGNSRLDLRDLIRNRVTAGTKLQSLLLLRYKVQSKEHLLAIAEVTDNALQRLR